MMGIKKSTAYFEYAVLFEFKALEFITLEFVF